MELEFSEQVQRLIDQYSSFHKALFDMLVTVKAIEETDLLQYAKRALLAVFLDASDEELSETVRTQVERKLSRACADMEYDPMRSFSATHLKQAVAKINDKLSGLELEIAVSNDMDKEHCMVYTLINKKGTGAIQALPQYSEKQRDLIRLAIDAIFNEQSVKQNPLTRNYLISPTQMSNHIRENTSFSGITETDTKNVISMLIDHGWLESVLDRLTVSIKALKELHEYLLENYDDTITACHGCSEILTRGKICKEPNCFTTMHEGCRKKVKFASESLDCPNEECGGKLDEYNPF